MKDVTEFQKNLIEYYENARESFIAKMRLEDDERSNLKFKIAAFVIHELSYSTPEWFKNHFLTYIAKNDCDAGVRNENVLKVENAFYDVVADYLIRMESEVDYVKKVLAKCADDREKKNFWEPIVFDSFLIVGIYFTPSMEFSQKQNSKTAEKPIERNIHSRYVDCNQSAYGRNMSFRFNKSCMMQGINPR